MKKTYTIPATYVAEMKIGTILMASGVASNKGIGYGGVDNEGSKDPESRQLRNPDEWEEEEW